MEIIHIKNVKQFMGELFAGVAFDDFYVTSCEINMITKITIDGKRSKRWSEDNGGKTFCSWKEIKELVYNVIRGSKSPSLFKIVFSKRDESEMEVYEGNGIITLKFEDDTATITTGYISKEFTLDKTAEKEWDIAVSKWFERFE